MTASPLKHSRIDGGLTLFELGRRTRINPGRLSMIERRLVKPRRDEMERLATALQIESRDLFDKEQYTSAATNS